MKMKFTRQDQHKKKRLNKGWRKPKGLQNKMRLSRKSYKLKVRPGYGTKNLEKNTLNGKEIVYVNNIEDLKTMDPKKQIIIITKQSTKNKLEIIKEAKKLGFEFANFNPDKYTDAVTKKQEEKKQAKKAKQEKEKSKKKTEEKKVEKKEEPKEEKTETKEEPKEENKNKDKDKVLRKSK